MKPKTYFLTTFILFIGVGTMHLMRIVLGWRVTIGDGVLPMWVSWVGVGVVGYIARSAYKLYKN